MIQEDRGQNKQLKINNEQIRQIPEQNRYHTQKCNKNKNHLNDGES